MRLAATAEPFRVVIPEADLDNLRRRLALTRWPAEPAGAAWQYGSNGDYMRRFVARWLDGFDWRAWEAKLNAWPQYRLRLPRHDEAGGEQVVHVLVEPGSGPAPRPLLLTHGWPGSVFEFLAAIAPLAHPERFGGRVEDAFTVICPSLPGYGFSLPLTQPIGPRAIARLWRDLMVDGFGFERFFVQAGDWGSIVSSWLGADHPAHVAALHLNFVPLRPPLAKDAPLTPDESAWIARVKKIQAAEAGYHAIQATKPSTLGFAMADSPAGMAAWIVEKFHGFARGPADSAPPFDMDHLIANVAWYWLTGSMVTATWLYRAAAETNGLAMRPGDFVRPPTAFLLPPWDLVPPPPAGWLERGYNVVRRRDLERGGHFVAMEQPQAFVADVRDFFATQGL